MRKHFLAFDVGATKTAWGRFNPKGELLESGQTSTPTEPEPFIALLLEQIKQEEPLAVGIGLAGTISAEHGDILVCTNLPALSHVQLVNDLASYTSVPVTLDNDARCALIGEIWQGGAEQYQDVVLLTLGSGVGGAVMQQRVILPHPLDISQEIGRLVVDPTDVFPSPTGEGTLEALLGGINLERRLQVSLAEIARLTKAGDPEALGLWKRISQYFIAGIRVVHDQFQCEAIIIGGKGSQDLELYLQDTPPCPVLAAKLGGEAGLYGAARIGMDHYAELKAT